jgi:hypothetical protein
MNTKLKRAESEGFCQLSIDILQMLAVICLLVPQCPTSLSRIF